MNGKRALILVGLSVLMMPVLLQGSLQVQEATAGTVAEAEASSISAEAVLLTVLVGGSFLLLHSRTRLFGGACVIAGLLVLFLLYSVASQVA